MSKILVSPSSFGQCGMEPLNILEQHGYEIVNNPYGRKLTEDEVVELAGDVIGVVAGVETYNKNVLDKLPNLKCLSRVGVGMDSIDMDYAKSKDVDVVNTPQGPTLAVAELSIGLALDLLRRISISDRRIRAGVWKKEIGNLINGRVVGIIGLGQIGKKAATLYKALGCEVIAYDKYPDTEWMKANNVTNSSMDEVLSGAELISLHVPGSSDGVAVINKRELDLLQPGAIIINVSRGGVVQEDDLLAYLKSNPDTLCALDVFKQEPYTGPFTELDNVVLTPHLGSYAKDAKLNMEIDAVKNLISSLS